MDNSTYMNFIILIVFIILMYFILIRPQRKKDKEVSDMRSNLKVGDEIVTIGGIMGKIVKTGDESVVIEVGANKTKFEIKKWAISTVEKKAISRKTEEKSADLEDRKIRPKRLGKKENSPESMEEEVKDLSEEN